MKLEIIIHAKSKQIADHHIKSAIEWLKTVKTLPIYKSLPAKMKNENNVTRSEAMICNISPLNSNKKNV